MRIGVAQFSPKFGKKEENIARIASAVEGSHSDLILFPELCTTGYQFVSEEEVEKLSEPVPDGPTTETLVRLCRDKNFHLVAGLAERDGETFYNTSVLVGPSGFIGTYRKVHLFCEEKRWFQPGNLGFPVWNIGTVRVGMMICFDWVFPEAARELALQGADVICHPVNLVLPFCQDAMITRSIENGVFSITANRVGSEARGGRDRLTFTGGSQVVGPRGELLFRLGSDVEAYQEIAIDPALARNKMITAQNHLLEDRRKDQYRQISSQ